LGERLKQETLQPYLGRTVSVLIEGSGEKGGNGYTPSYLRVAIEADQEHDLFNRIVDCEITGLSEDRNQLTGRPRP
jgi:tRNA A37 methylthiotransferase MiaB